MKKILSFFAAMLFAGSMMATDYKLVSSASELEAGGKYIVGASYNGKSYFMGIASNANNRKEVEGSINEGVVTATDDMLVLSLDGKEGAWTFETVNYAGTAGYLNATSTTGSNNLKVVADLDDYAYFSIAIEDGVATVICTGKESRNILYLNGTTCFSCYNAQTSAQYVKPSLFKAVGGTEPPVETKYYMKNNWNAGSEWTWKEMSKSVTGAGLYVLEKAVFGGTGVNYNTAETDEGAEWVPLLDIKGDAIAAKDTVTFVLNPTEKSVTANLVGKYQEGGEPPVVTLSAMVKGLNGNWDGDEMAVAADQKTASVVIKLAEGEHQFKMFINGEWRSNAYKYHRGFTSAESITGNELDNMILTADVAGEYGFTWTFESNKLEITFPAAPADPNQMYIWDGSGAKAEEDAIEKGGKAEAVQADGTNIAVGVSQKGNWCLKANKGFNDGKYYLGIALDNAVNAGDQIVLGFFRTTDKNTYILGMDFSADKESASTDYQILTTDDPEVLTSNGVPSDVTFNVPEGVKDAKYIRIYRNSGSTGLWVSKFAIVKGGDVPPVVEDKYYMKNNWDNGSEWYWKEMEKDDETNYKLANVVFGGTGVNWNTAESDEGSNWVELAKIVVPEGITLEAKDTLDFILDPVAEVVSARNIRKFNDGGDVPPVVEDKYYMKNNWDNGSEWYWKEMSKSVTAAGLFVLEDAIYGGTGVNFNTEEKDETATWVPEDQFVIAQELKLEPKDTANFLLNPKPAEGEAYISVVNIRKFQDVPVVGCNWDDIEWFNVGLGEGDENFNQFKICKAGELPNVVNIQTAPWADNNKGIYINFPSAEFTTISLPEGQYKVDGAGILLFLSAFSATETEVSILYKGEPVVFTVYNAKVDIPEVKYYMKNNWDAGSEWTWKEMTKMEGADGIYRLEQVIFGGTGVNYNTKADDEGAAWVELKDIVVPEGMELAAKDTADFQLEIAGPAPVVRALGIRKFQGGEPPIGTPLYYITGESLVGSWAPDALPVYEKSLYEFESVKAGSYSFKITVDGTWATAKGYDDLTLKQDGLSKDNDGNICFTLAEDGPVAVLYTDEEFIVRGNFVVPEPPVSEWDEIIFKETDVAEKGQTAKSFVSDTNEKFVLSVTDDDSKIAIDANSARFGTPVLYSMYRHRLKTGGKSSAKNALSLAIPADGQLRIAVRTGSNGATDRTLVLKQNDVELFNSVIQESDAEAVDEDGTEVNVYPYVTVNVKAGNVAVEYPVNGLNFYEFGFKAGEVPPVEDHTYSVVGPLTPGGWDATSTACDMVLGADGIYRFTLEGVTLATNTSYEYKIVQDHSWAVAFPEQGNATFRVEKSGIYDLAFSLDLNAEVPYAVVPDLKEEIVVIPSVAMHGNFTGGWGDTDNFAVSDDEQSASLKLTLAKGNYEFGMRIGGPNNWMSNGVEFTRENPSAVVEAGSGNLKLAADAEGEYTFTWIFERSTLVITFPAAGPVEDPTAAVIGSMTQWQEALPFVLSEDKKSAMLYVDKIPAGQYEFKMLINGEYRSNGYRYHRDFPGAAGISENVAANMVLDVDAMGEFTFIWFFETDSLYIIFPEIAPCEFEDGLYIVGTMNNWEKSKDYMLEINSGAEGEYWCELNLNEGDEFKILWWAECKAMAWIPGGEQNIIVTREYAGKVRVYFRPEGNPEWPEKYYYIEVIEPQNINNTEANTKVVKMLENGQLFIQKGGKTYNVLGTLVK